MIPINQHFSNPLIDRKINSQSWMITMRIEDYLKMADLESNIYQRNIQNLSFYKKLINDLLDDSIIPPISVVYPKEKINFEEGLDPEFSFIILDGLQRTNCLLECVKRLENNKSTGVITELKDFYNKEIYIEVWGKLELKHILYKMIVLNTGQKKMDYNHQLDILSESVARELEYMGINFSTTKEKLDGGRKDDAIPLSIITQGLVSFINGSPIPSKKNAAEFLFEKFDLSSEENKLGFNVITDNQTYKYLKWVLVDFNKLLEERYGDNNPIYKYDVFLISFFAAIGNAFKFDPENLDKNLNTLAESFETQIDPLDLQTFEYYYNQFKSGIGVKRRRYIFEGFRDYFTSPIYVNRLEWAYVYNRI